MDEMPRFEPQTAREALLAIRKAAAEVHADSDVHEVSCQIDRLALEGLQRTGPINFELSDQLADRLAEAHKLLREVLETEVGSMGGAIDQALALPPDLEAMVERRIGHG
jgi:hypothetical protein